MSGAKRIGIYARYSTDDQRPTSIEDQHRTCIEKLKQLGFDVSNVRLFSDSRISGNHEKTAQRVGLKELLAAWDNNELDIVAADEVSRLARAPRQLAEIQERVSRTGVRLITADGHDSSSPTFALTYGIAAAMASYALDETTRRVRRSMKGQLERGYMIAYPPFGYRAIRKTDPSDRALGTVWEVIPEQAEIVREIYERRSRGTSLVKIAAYLNSRNISTPRKPRGGLMYWRPGTVFQLIRNPVYRGIVFWNGSAHLRAKAKRQNRVLEPQAYSRPHLRIVPDSLWEACNSGGRRWKRGGDKSIFSGIIRCGECDAILSVSRGKAREQLYCAQCHQAVWAGARKACIGYVSTEGLRAALIAVMELICSEAVIQRYKERLKARLTRGVDAELEEVERELLGVVTTGKKLLRLISAGVTDTELESQYLDKKAQEKILQERLEELRERAAATNSKAIEAQLSTDPREYLEALFKDAFPPERLRAMLARLFPRLILLGKQGRGTASFLVEVSPSAVLAEASETKDVKEAPLSSTVRVKCIRTEPVHWNASVEVLRKAIDQGTDPPTEDATKAA